jgi:hypothetical protein
MTDSDKITVWIVDDHPRHNTLIEFDSAPADVHRQIDEILRAVAWKPTSSMEIIQRDGSLLHILVVAVP